MENSNSLFHDVPRIINFLNGKLTLEETEFIQKAIQESHELREFVEGIRLDLEENKDKKPVNEFMDEVSEMVSETLKNLKVSTKNEKDQNQNFLLTLFKKKEIGKVCSESTISIHNFYRAFGLNQILIMSNKKGTPFGLVALKVIVLFLFIYTISSHYNKPVYFSLSNETLKLLPYSFTLDSKNTTDPKFENHFQAGQCTNMPKGSLGIFNGHDDCAFGILSNRKITAELVDYMTIPYKCRSSRKFVLGKIEPELAFILDSIALLSTEITLLD
ncbi:MAG: hypothetical protein IT258_23670, partial [Saprospiraceae bacterium]|nr:hypothetical protein [Saprospiraceae bacterium]